MTFEKQDASTPNTFEAPKRSANLVPLTSTTTSVVTVRSLQEESKSKLFVGSRPGNSSCIKQASGGLEDFLLMRKGKLGTRTSSTHPPCTPPSKKEFSVKRSVVLVNYFGLYSSSLAQIDLNKA